jgi:hypothetical protein
MTDRWMDIGEGFWNVRGSFKVGGLFDVGTQTSLVRLQSGGFVLLDAYELSGDVKRQVMELTDGGRAVQAILNLHPFHTQYVAAAAAQFPEARLYGTRRHKALAPQLRWEALHTDEAALHAQFASDLEFSVPRGVDFIPSNQALHFASVLAFHKPSATLHVDDTLSFIDLPLVGGLKFHPTLRFVLQKRQGAASEFRDWCETLCTLSERTARVCTAHTRTLPSFTGPRIAAEVRKALAQIEPLIDSHARRHG